MEKITLKNGEIVKIFVSCQGLINYENANPGNNLVKALASNGGIPPLETILKVLYVGYVNGANKTNYSFDEFIELLEFDIDEIFTVYTKVSKKQKKSVSKTL